MSLRKVLGAIRQADQDFGLIENQDKIAVGISGGKDSIVLLYALSTLISWAYYGQKSWNFLFGEGKKRTLTFQFIYCSFIVIGSVLNVTSVINITDAMMIAMSIPNIIAMYILAPEIKKDLADYCRLHQLGKWVNRDWLKPVPVKAETEEDEVLCQINKLS